MAELKNAEYKSELQKVQEELTETKKKYISMKKTGAETGALPKLSASVTNKSEVKIAGGGFRMSVQRFSS